MPQIKSRGYQAGTVFLLLVCGCFIYITTSSSQAIERQADPSPAAEATASELPSLSEQFIEDYPKFIRKKLSSSCASSYLGADSLDALQRDMMQFIKKRVPRDLTEEQARTILNGTGLFIDHTLGNCFFGEFPNAWENLKWRVAAVLRTRHLSEEETTQLHEQRRHINRLVQEFATLFHHSRGRTADSSLRLFNSFCDDPFLPYLKKPLGKREWRIFCHNWEFTKGYAEKLPDTEQPPDVLETVYSHLTVMANPMKARSFYIKITDYGPLVHFWHPRSPSHLTCFAYDNPAVMPHTAVSIAKSQVLDVNAPKNVSHASSNSEVLAMTEKEAITLAQKAGGDFVYAGQSNELVGVNGTQFAVIKKGCVADVSLIPDKELQRLLDTMGRNRFSLNEYESRVAEYKGRLRDTDVPHNNIGELTDAPPKPPEGILLAVRDGKRHLVILHILAVCSSDSPIARESGACVCADLYTFPIAPWGLNDKDYAPSGDMAPLGHQQEGLDHAPAKKHLPNAANTKPRTAVPDP